MADFITCSAEPGDLEAVNTLLAIFANPDTPLFVYDKERTVLGYAICDLNHQESGFLMPLTTLYMDDICE